MTSRWLFPREEIEKPVKVGGTSSRTATKYRMEMARFIRKLGDPEFLDIPQLTIATATLYMHRFFLRRDFSEHDREIVALACILLAGKVEESPRKLKMILSKANQLMRNLPKEDLQFITTPKFNDMKERVLIAERVLLQTISFDLMVEHPYRHLKPFATSIPVPSELFTPEMTQEERLNAQRAFTHSIVQRAWNFVNDSFATTLCLQHPPKSIATAASYLACRTLSIKIPDTLNGKPFYEAVEVNPQVLEEIINQILDLYHKKEGASSSGQSVAPPNPDTAPPAGANTSASSPAKRETATPNVLQPQDTMQLREYSPASPNLPSPSPSPSPRGQHLASHSEFSSAHQLPHQPSHHQQQHQMQHQQQPRSHPHQPSQQTRPWPASHPHSQHHHGGQSHQHPHHSGHGDYNRQMDHRRDDHREHNRDRDYHRDRDFRERERDYRERDRDARPVYRDERRSSNEYRDHRDLQRDREQQRRRSRSRERRDEFPQNRM